MKKIHLLSGPFIKSNNSTSKMMIHLFIALLPIILFSFYKNGIYLYVNNYISFYEMFYPLIFVIVGGLTSFIGEALYHKLFLHKNIKECFKGNYGIFPGLFLSLILPLKTPLLMLILGSFIASIVGKMIYGGFGNNIFNPALIGLLFLAALYSGSMGSYLNAYEIDTISGATPLTNLATVEEVNYESVVSPYGSLWNFLFGMIPGSVGETCSILLILSFIYLSLTKVIKSKITIFYVGTVFVLTFIIGSINGFTIWYPLFQILSGGLLFGAVFMATDPVTSPVTDMGQILYGICLGLLTVIFRFFTSAPEGVMTSILTMNMFVFIIDKIGSKNKNRKTIIYAFMCLFLITFSFITGYFVNKKSVDNNFEVISITTNNYGRTYLVNEKGNGGNIKIEITLHGSKVVSYKVLEHNETKAYYSKVESSKYIEKLIENSNNLNNVDTVSGATISSKALKKALENVLELEKNYEK